MLILLILWDGAIRNRVDFAGPGRGLDGFLSEAASGHAERASRAAIPGPPAAVAVIGLAAAGME